jgi:hypothetical protein
MATVNKKDLLDKVLKTINATAPEERVQPNAPVIPKHLDADGNPRAKRPVAALYTSAVVVEPESTEHKEAFRKNVLEKLFVKGDVVALQTSQPEQPVSVYDYYVKSIDLYVNVDDPGYHGTNKTSGWSIEQVCAIACDLEVNRSARETGINFVRFSSKLDKKMPKNVAELLALAYHRVQKGEAVVDGSFKFTDDKHAIFSREQLIRINETEIFPDALGREHTKTRVQPVLFKFFRAYVAYHGWFYPESEEALSDVIEKLSTVSSGEDGCLRVSNHGSTWLKSVVKSYWQTADGPVDSFDSDVKLNRVLAYRCGLNTSKLYDYTLEDGKKISCHETFEINISNIRNGFIVQRTGVSWFKPSYAVDVYRKYVGHLKNPVVWDPSIGFSARLLGFASVFNEGVYIGTDPSSLAHRDALVVAEKLNELKSNVFFDLRKEGSEVTELPESSFDLVFTSPPYFDKEKYIQEPGQCWRDYPNLEKWSEKYLKPTLRTAFKCLRADGKLVLNVGADIENVVISVAAACGFTLVDTLQLKMTRDHYNRHSGTSDTRSDPVLVFEKTVKV